jgi:hypothetical protein
MGLVNIDVGTVMSGLGTLARDLRAAITGKEPIDATKAAELALKAQELDQKVVESENALLLAQAEINKVESASSSKWVSGWRPYFGWAGGTVIVYTYILRPLLMAAGLALPEININELWPVILGILGLGGMRSYDKVKGTAK